MSLLLAIETSCDESAVAVVSSQKEGATIEHALISSQIDLHRQYGGVVPELASRSHSQTLPLLVETALEQTGYALRDFEGFAATGGPGLSSSLLIGHSMAKGFAVANQRPFYSVNHMEGHLLSPFLETRYAARVPEHLALIVSGGHTMMVQCRGLGQYELLAQTRDDAVGEAFDKVGRLLGLPYPGGPEIEARAREGNPKAFVFPRSLPATLDFSFSGLKTAVLYTLKSLSCSSNNPPRGALLADLCASFQAAVLDTLTRKVLKAQRQTQSALVTLSGGVSCNEALRQRLACELEEKGVTFLPCSRAHSTDNAAMIGYAASFYHQQQHPSALSENISPSLPLAK